MTIFSSLRSRIFLTSALLAVLSIAVAIYLVNVRVTREAEGTLQREILTTGTLFDQLRTTRTRTYTTVARLVADIPKLKAAASTNDPQTVQDTLEAYQRELKLGANLLLVTNKTGAVLAVVGTAAPEVSAAVAGQPLVRDALAGHESVALLPQPNGILQLITVPIAIYETQPEILGSLSVGFLLDDEFAAQLKAITGSDIALGMNGQILATTLAESRSEVAAFLGQSDMLHDVHVGAEDYVVLPRRLAPTATLEAGGGPMALILRSRTEHLAGLRAIHAGLGLTAVVAVMLATLLSFAVARTITRPLAAITDVMKEVAATGDLTLKTALTQGRGWEDEDARLLATTFNTLTDSIARFQREMSQKERLSSLGQLSTVIAHEIRNPLMIIRASLHALRRADVGAATIREAVADIDDEVTRLNRIVNEVLDFARPIRFELSSTDINALCRDSAAAAEASGTGPAVRLILERSLPALTTDAERLRVALVNIIVNARHAVVAREPVVAVQIAGSDAGGVGRTPIDVGEPSITVETRSAGERTAILVTDRGIGIDSRDVARIFDPYFTTKRGGTGLGLAIAKNIVEGLHGTIAVTSAPGRGTEIRIDLPRAGGAPVPR